MLLEKRGLLRVFAVSTFFLNLVSLIYGVVYILIGGNAPFVNFFGVIILLALTFNILLAYLNELWGAEGKLKHIGSFYLAFSLLAFLVMIGGGIAVSNVYERSLSYLILYVLVYPAFLITLLLGIIHSRLTLRSFSSNFPIKKRFVLNAPGLDAWAKVLVVVLFLFFFPALFFVYILLTDYLGLLQMIVSQYAIFMAFCYFTLAAIILRILKQQHGFLRLFTGLGGFVMFIIFLFPLFLTPRAASEAEAAFSEAFGVNWLEAVSDYEEYFLPHRFSIPAYFLGVPPDDYSYERDILYYEGLEGADEGITLYFDVYMPPEGSEALPGHGSTLIRIHGGAWMAGSKGLYNMMQMNKYFASRGYTVFDIQYGLTDKIDLLTLNSMYEFINIDRNKIPSFVQSLTVLGAPDNVVGDFSLDDMIRHLGIFTYYLEENADKYGANLGSVFISGGSAGGHLATAMALAIASGEYQDIFSPEIEVRGFIPFYPGNKVDKILEAIGGADEWQDVELLVRQDSPPCLIYQGEKDGMVLMETSQSFHQKYLAAGNNQCAVIYLPLGAHASDFHFAGNYNIPFVYYMERFMALHR